MRCRAPAPARSRRRRCASVDVRHDSSLLAGTRTRERSSVGHSQYFEVWPDALARSLITDPETWAAFGELWGRCSGMHGWFHEAPEELPEIAAASSQRGVDRVRDLLAKSPPTPNAFLYKSLREQAAILQSALKGPDAAEAARELLCGDEPAEAGAGFRVTSKPKCQELARRLAETDLTGATRAFASSSGRDHLCADDLRLELEQLVDTYRCAADGGHRVITREF